MSKMIKNVIFDLGNVLLDIDPKLSSIAFEKLGFSTFDQQYTLKGQSDLFDNLETGHLKPQELRDAIRSISKLKLKDSQIDEAWNALILEYFEDRIQFVESMRSEFKVFLLSNTNIIHYWFYSETFKKQFGKEFKSIFDKGYLSHEVGLRKPNANIYEYVLSDSNLIPEETLFIDDNKPNIEAAIKLGIQTIYLPVGTDFFKAIEEFGLEISTQSRSVIN